jgi:hypothetical protein
MTQVNAVATENCDKGLFPGCLWVRTNRPQDLAGHPFFDPAPSVPATFDHDKFFPPDQDLNATRVTCHGCHRSASGEVEGKGKGERSKGKRERD